jgi:hypothetical protein
MGIKYMEHSILQMKLMIRRRLSRRIIKMEVIVLDNIVIICML